MADNARVLGMLSHLLGAFTSVLGPLVVWLVGRRGSDLVAANGRSAVNFALTVLLISLGLVVIGTVLVIVLPDLTIVGGIFFLLWFLVAVAAFVLHLLGALKAFGGAQYEYPWSLNLVK